MVKLTRRRFLPAKGALTLEGSRRKSKDQRMPLKPITGFVFSLSNKVCSETYLVTGATRCTQ
jgi:hypothetical protein